MLQSFRGQVAGPCRATFPRMACQLGKTLVSFPLPAALDLAALGMGKKVSERAFSDDVSARHAPRAMSGAWEKDV